MTSNSNLRSNCNSTCNDKSTSNSNSTLKLRSWKRRSYLNEKRMALMGFRWIPMIMIIMKTPHRTCKLKHFVAYYQLFLKQIDWKEFALKTVCDLKNVQTLVMQWITIKVKDVIILLIKTFEPFDWRHLFCYHVFIHSE